MTPSSDLDGPPRAPGRGLTPLPEFAAALDSIEDFVYLFDLEGRFTYANRPLLDLWGLERTDAVGKGFAELGYPPDLVDLHRRQIEEVVETGRPIRDDNAYVAPDGGEGHYEYIFTPILGEGGSVVAVAGVTRDVTVQRRAEGVVRAREQWYQALFEQAPAFMALLRGPEHRFEFVNPAFLLVVGDRPLVGLGVREALPELEGQGFYELLDEVYTTGRPYSAADQPVLLRRGGAQERVIVDFVYEPLRAASGAIEGVIALGVDTTDRAAAQEEVARANRELEGRVTARTAQVQAQSARIRSLSQALSLAEQEERRRLAHVLHDDLQQVLHGAQIQAGLGKTDRVEALLGEAAGIVRTLSHELAPPILPGSSIGELFEWLAERERDLYGLHVEHDGNEIDIPDEWGRVLLYRLLRELLFNVSKHAGTNRARLWAERYDDGVRVLVEDEGVGFDPAGADSPASGGLGLASARKRLEAVGGRLEIVSSPGEGTRVTIEIPRGTEDAG